MVTETEALRAQFEREFGKSPYVWNFSRFPEKSPRAEHYTDLKTQYGWEGYQAGHAAAKAETADVGEPVAFAHFSESGQIRLWLWAPKHGALGECLPISNRG